MRSRRLTIACVYEVPHCDNQRVLKHPANAAVLAFLRPLSVRGAGNAFSLRTHPDFVEFLERRAAPLEAQLQYLFGVAALTSANGLVFAYAVGTDSIVLRVPEHGFTRDLLGANDQVEELPGWVTTRAWRAVRVVRDGQDALDQRIREAALAASSLTTGRSRRG